LLFSELQWEGDSERGKTKKQQTQICQIQKGLRCIERGLYPLLEVLPPRIMDTEAATCGTNRSKLLSLLVIVLAIFSFVLFTKNQEMQQLILSEKEVTGEGQERVEAAQRIVDRLRRHIDIPTDIEPTVATIVDVDTLRERNPFYDRAENGDHLIVTRDRAILYDPDADVIIDVVPVQIQPVVGG